MESRREGIGACTQTMEVRWEGIWGRGIKLTMQGRWEGQWQHNRPHMAGGRVSGSTTAHSGKELRVRGMHKGPWRAEGRWQGLESDNRGSRAVAES